MKAPESTTPKNAVDHRTKPPRPSKPLVNSVAAAKREEATLKRERERLASEPTVSDDDAHATLI